MHRVLPVADGAAEDQEAVVDETVHEGGVLVPGVLLPAIK